MRRTTEVALPAAGTGKASGMAKDTRPEAVLITDAAPSFSAEQHQRTRRYTILMAVHLITFALAGVLYFYAWWLGLVLLVITTPLPWIAVVLANSPSRPFRRAPRTRPRGAVARRRWTRRAGTLVDPPARYAPEIPRVGGAVDPAIEGRVDRLRCLPQPRTRGDTPE